ncbi:RHS repeat-associated core domain-containing protein [Vibrio rhizosphaerae]|uniref:RHS repeat-associated core domain-containing protein n=1 Tax=Vibrio rhizosphaerae TaxID=398736 RepID=A0ABU4IXU6_9VIBR|nr:RHS repeat-associated core domain-containing protein [Vibrio rhizosphaerae]MDW6093942.1 RHS repeat-associated core domain-containing protein [Vibrio rhizosphaerae]
MITRHDSNRQDLHYIVTDHAGAPQELVSEAGEIEWRGEQALWGKYQQQQFNLKIQRGYLEDAANEALTCDLRYQGQIEDRESGLYYNLNRYYAADSGQYLSPDLIGFAGGLRPQGYVHNPMEWVDPLGLMAFGSGKGTHTANATLFDKEGNIKATGTWQSGNMTPDEAALGFPKSTLATHTEARITKDLGEIASPGDHLVIDGQYPPCNPCKGKMNAFQRDTGASVTYNWSEDGENKVWKAGCKGKK